MMHVARAHFSTPRTRHTTNNARHQLNTNSAHQTQQTAKGKSQPRRLRRLLLDDPSSKRQRSGSLSATRASRSMCLPKAFQCYISGAPDLANRDIPTAPKGVHSISSCPCSGVAPPEASCSKMGPNNTGNISTLYDHFSRRFFGLLFGHDHCHC